MTKLLNTMWIISYLKHIKKKLCLYDVCTDKYGNIISIMLYYSLSNPQGEHTLKVYYEELTTDKLVKHGFPCSIDVYLMHGSNGVFLPRCSRTICF